MTDLVPAEDIEQLVGARRHRRAHLGYADATTETVFILHSQECKDSGIDLRDCSFSLALDHGIDLDVWADDQDRTVMLVVYNGRLHAAPVALDGTNVQLIPRVGA